MRQANRTTTLALIVLGGVLLHTHACPQWQSWIMIATAVIGSAMSTLVEFISSGLGTESKADSEERALMHDTVQALSTIKSGNDGEAVLPPLVWRRVRLNLMAMANDGIIELKGELPGSI